MKRKGNSKAFCLKEFTYCLGSGSVNKRKTTKKKITTLFYFSLFSDMPAEIKSKLGPSYPINHYKYL